MAAPHAGARWLELCSTARRATRVAAKMRRHRFFLALLATTTTAHKWDAHPNEDRPGMRAIVQALVEFRIDDVRRIWKDELATMSTVNFVMHKTVDFVDEVEKGIEFGPYGYRLLTNPARNPVVMHNSDRTSFNIVCNVPLSHDEARKSLALLNTIANDFRGRGVRVAAVSFDGADELTALEREQADEAGVAIATFDGQTSKWQHQIGALERLQLYFVRKDGRVFWKGHVGMIAHDGKLTGDGPIVKALEVLRAMPQYDGTESFHLHERLAKAEPKGRQLEGLERDPDARPRENSIRPGYVDDALKARQQEMKGEL